MTRAPNSELTERINVAVGLLRRRFSKDKVMAALRERYGVSKRQAYRYIQEAQRTKRKLPIPERKEVFTVKLSVRLVFRLRQFATSTGQSLSSIVAQALEAFIKRRGHG